MVYPSRVMAFGGTISALEMQLHQLGDTMSKATGNIASMRLTRMMARGKGEGYSGFGEDSGAGIVGDVASDSLLSSIDSCERAG